ncbi:MAG: diguanylate cyclase [Rhizobacter sp.]|nr:diguanylate cyclase [Rhizobacter sp.]
MSHLTQPLSSPMPAAQARSRLPQRMRMPRTLGLALGGLCVAGGLAQHGAPAWVWALLLVNALVWPQLAHALSSRSATPVQAEEHNLLADAALGGFWVAAMGFNLLPSVLIVAMLWMNNLAVGGRRLFTLGVLAQAAALGVGLLLLAPQVELASSVQTIASCLPFLVAYPMTIGWINHRLSSGLARQRHELAASEHLHRATLDAMDAGIVLYDAHDRLVLCNAQFRELYGPLAHLFEPGKTFEALMREAIARGMVPEAVGREEQWLAERMRQHRYPSGPIDRRFPNGRWRRIVEQRLPDGSLLAFSTDITELKEKKRALESSQREAEQASQRLQDAIDALPDGFALYDASDRLLVLNRKYREIYAVTSRGNTLVGRTFEELLRDGLARGQYPDAIGCEEAWLATRLQRHFNPTGEPLMQQLPGNRWVRINESRTREGGCAGVRVDVTDLVRREQELERLNRERDSYAQQLQEANAILAQLSETDGLTGLANRRLFDQRLEQEWQRARRHGSPLALLMVDVDHFKRLNDTLGHLAGDECLRRVARVLKGCGMRSSDLVARFGGEEFALLLPHTTREEAAAVAARCLAAVDAQGLANPGAPPGSPVTVSIGLGMARFAEGAEASSLVREADQALYRAKSLGRHRVEALPS